MSTLKTDIDSFTNPYGKEIISDAAIISLIKENNPLAWEHLYYKYSSLMYAAVERITDNKAVADETLKKVVVQLKSSKFILGLKENLRLNLMYQTYLTAIRFLENRKTKGEGDYLANKSSIITNYLSHRPEAMERLIEILPLPAEVSDELKSELIRIHKQEILGSK